MPSICSPEHLVKAGELRRLLATYKRSEDLLRIRAYLNCSDAPLDRAVEVLPEVERFLQQRAGEICPSGDAVRRLLALPS